MAFPVWSYQQGSLLQYGISRFDGYTSHQMPAQNYTLTIVLESYLNLPAQLLIVSMLNIFAKFLHRLRLLPGEKSNLVILPSPSWLVVRLLT